MSTNAEDKAITEAEAARRADLNEGVDVRVPKGDEANPPPRIVDQMDARKALYKRGRDTRTTQITNDSAAHPDAAEMQAAMDAEVRGETRVEMAPERTRYEERQPAPPPAAKPPSANANERVTVKVNGKEFDVPKRDVDEAGGVEAYQKRRAAAIVLNETALLRKKAQAELAEAEKIRRDLEGRAAQGAPATREPPPGGTQQPPATGAAGGKGDVGAEASEIVKALYSGDPKRAAEAVAKVLTAARSGVTPEQVADQALAMLNKRAAEAPGEKREPAVTEFDPAERKAANEMMSREYADVMSNAAARDAATKQFMKLANDPNNAGRSLVEMSREAGEHARATVRPHPRQETIDRKRTLPPQSAAAGKPPVAVDEPLLPRGSGYVAELRRRSGRPY